MWLPIIDGVANAIETGPREWKMAEDSPKPLAGKVALVTGAVRRIGRAIALRLAQDGAAVIIHARVSEAEGRAVTAEVAGHGVESLLCPATSAVTARPS